MFSILFFSFIHIENIRHFIISEGNGECLEDKPDTNLLLSNSNLTRPYPGTIYDYDMQCKLRYGKNSTHCYKDSLMVV